MSKFLKIAAIVTLLVIGLPIVLGINGCGKKSKKDKSTTAGSSSTTPSIVIVGEVGSGYDYTYIPSTLFEKFCYAFTNKAFAIIGPTVNKVIAMPFEGGYIDAYCMTGRKEALINTDGSFSLSLEKDRNWLLILVNTNESLYNQFVGYVALTDYLKYQQPQQQGLNLI